MIKEDQQEQNNKQLRQEKLNAAARRKLFCDVKAVQQQQREEKGILTFLFVIYFRLVTKFCSRQFKPFSFCSHTLLYFFIKNFLTLLVYFVRGQNM